MQQQEEAAHSLHPLQVGPQPLNTPEELRAIRQAMGEGKNPLVATDVPRWEDQVSVASSTAAYWSWSRCPRPRKCSLNSR